MNLKRFGRTVQMAILGLGQRGMSEIDVLAEMPDVRIRMVCDVYPDRVEAARQRVLEKTGDLPVGVTDAKMVMEDSCVEAVLIMTGWETHIPLAIETMRRGKRPAMEVGGANSVEECWRLVRAYEETGVPVMMLENCCYGETELTILNMVRQKLFGTLVHCTGAYSHDLREEVGNGDRNRHYRLRHFLHRNGELYPTHALGPIASWLDINRGNRMLSLVSMSSKACGLHQWFRENRPDSPLVDAQINQGDIVTTMIRCANGETILLTHDCTLPRPYSRGQSVRGTRGCWMEENRSVFLEGISPHDPADWTHRWESDARVMDRYRHPLWTRFREEGVRGGHGGMDYLVLRAFVESVQKGVEPPIDVYDAASWMSVTALSEASIAGGSRPVEIPDFTSGRWYAGRAPALSDTFAPEEESGGSDEGE